jgi:thiamine monophosphate synthase
VFYVAIFLPQLYAITPNPSAEDSSSDFVDFLAKIEEMIRRFGIELLQFRAKTLSQFMCFYLRKESEQMRNYMFVTLECEQEK